MTVRLTRTFEFDAPAERVWEFIADPAKRADAISVVSEYEVHDDGSATWQVELPIPLVKSTVPVTTRDVELDAPTYVKFEGRSRALRVTGEHTVEAVGDGAKLHNEFIVEGRLPGVERFFTRNLDRELDNLERALRADLGLTA